MLFDRAEILEALGMLADHVHDSAAPQQAIRVVGGAAISVQLDRDGGWL